jgi:hypothetical protein
LKKKARSLSCLLRICLSDLSFARSTVYPWNDACSCLFVPILGSNSASARQEKPVNAPAMHGLTRGRAETLTSTMTRSHSGLLRPGANRCCRPGRWLWKSVGR